MAIDVKENSRLAFNITNKKSNVIKTLISDSDNSREFVADIALDLIDPLESFEHPFEKSVNIGIEELAESIKSRGVLEPIILRSKVGGRYETLAGHRRSAASRLAGKTQIKAIIKDCDDDTAKLIVTETNTEQRNKIFPSERAKAYRIQMEAMRNQGKRNDLINAIDNEENLWHSVPQVKSREIVAELNHVKARTISDYLRLNKLVKKLLDKVDDGEIPIKAAVELSHLKINHQIDLVDLLESHNEIKITTPIAEELRVASKEMELSQLIIEAIINPPKEDKLKDFKEKPPKAVYKTAFQSIEKKLKKLPEDKAVKLAMCDKDELEKIITDAVNNYLETL